MKKAFSPFVYNDSRILILGTMPGEKSLELGEYYGNKGNQFWRLIFSVFNRPIEQEYSKKINLLKEYNIAIWDVLEYCEREGSLDSNIRNEKANDFDLFYLEYPKIKHVLFSSKNAEKYYIKYIGKRPGLNYDILPSPSGANATKTFEQKLQEWKKKILPLIEND